MPLIGREPSHVVVLLIGGTVILASRDTRRQHKSSRVVKQGTYLHRTRRVSTDVGADVSVAEHAFESCRIVDSQGSGRGARLKARSLKG